MNRYPLWKYAVLGVALIVALLYTLPNFYGEAPAVQVSSGKATVKVEAAMVERVQQTLQAAGLQPDFVQFEGNSVRARFSDTDTQLKAKDAISAALNPDPADPRYIVALNLVSRSPQWMARAHALPMYLGLDLRGGVHFLMQVDMKAALTKRAEALTGDVRTMLREKNIRHSGITREGNAVDIRFRDAATATQAQNLLSDQLPDLLWQQRPVDGGEVVLGGALKPEAAIRVQEQAVKQNITTLHNRVNELGVAEPVIQQQGLDRVVVQLPGVQDTAKARTSSAAPRRWKCAWSTRPPRRARPSAAPRRCPSAASASSSATGGRSSCCARSCSPATTSPTHSPASTGRPRSRWST